MAKMRNLAVILAFLPVAALAAACGDGADERQALAEDELERELDLALEGDTVPATFQDTAVGAAPEPGPQPGAVPQRRPAQRRAQPAPRPQPREEPRERVAEATPQPRSRTLSVPTGTTFAVRLNETLSTETNQPGDAFTGTLSEPIVAADGATIIPAGATVRGRVTGVEQSGHVGETAVIKLGFEAISFGGESYPLRGTVVEANPERRGRSSAKEQAAKVAAGAAAGAILGKVLGKDTESALKGAVVGAAAGTAIAMGTADVDAVLPSGSRMVVRVDAPIEVRRVS